MNSMQAFVGSTLPLDEMWFIYYSLHTDLLDIVSHTRPELEVEFCDMAKMTYMSIKARVDMLYAFAEKHGLMGLLGVNSDGCDEQ